jgi:hypothetical protein
MYMMSTKHSKVIRSSIFKNVKGFIQTQSQKMFKSVQNVDMDLIIFLFPLLSNYATPISN